LKTVTAGGQSTGFVYNADGQRIIRTNADGTKNLYLPEIELKTALPPLPAHRASASGSNAGGAATVTVTKPVAAVAGDVLVASVAAADGPVIPVTTLSTKTFEKDVWTGYTRTTTSEAHTGSNALSVNAYNTESNVSFTVGTANTFKGWLKGTGTITPSVQFFSSTWSLVGSATVTNLTLSPTAWTQWTATYTPPTGTAFVKVFLGGATNPYFLDDVVVASGATTLSTSGFEADVWIGTTYTTSSQFHLGANSLIAVANAAGSSVGSNVSFTAGVPNTLSGWMKGNGTVVPRVSFYSPTWTWLGNATVPSKVLSATAWQQWSTTYTPPPGTGIVQVWMDSTDLANWYLDDVTVVAGGSGTLTAVTAPAGWTAVTKSGVAGEQLTTWTHTVAAGDPVSWSFGLSQSTKAVAAVSAYSAVDPTTPIDVSATGSNVSGTSHTAPSVVTTAANDLAVTVTSPIVVATMTPPAGSTERADQAGGTGVRTVSVETSDFPKAVAGATGTKVTVSTTAAISATATLALRQLATPGPTTYTRYYAFAGETIGMRQGTTGGGSDILQWMFGNHQASTSVATVAGSTTASRNRYLPYGGLRGSDAITTTDHGFLGQTEDTATGLDYLNNRYLDPTLGRFISVDPLLATTRDAYGYSNNNPITYSDPTGLEAGSWFNSGDEAWAYQYLRDAGATNPLGAFDTYGDLRNTWLMMGEGSGEIGRMTHVLNNVIADRTGREKMGISEFVTTFASVWLAPREGRAGGMASASEGNLGAPAPSIKWSGKNQLETEVANTLEEAFPGQVTGVNAEVMMKNGLMREVDVAVGDVLVQVKDGSGRGLIGQLLKTAETTGKRSIGYAPGLSDVAVRDGLIKGVNIARTIEELIALLESGT
jgi:RHS repeat-associated protein